MAIGAFIVKMGYDYLVPIWAISANTLTSLYPAMVGGDATFVSNFNNMAFNLNLLVQYSFVIMLLGIVGLYLLVFAYRRQFSSTFTGEEAY